jgi:hypothetical protein
MSCCFVRSGPPCKGTTTGNFFSFLLHSRTSKFQNKTHIATQGWKEIKTGTVAYPLVKGEREKQTPSAVVEKKIY